MALRRRGTAIVDTPNGILVVSESGKTYHLPGGVARKGESRRRAAIRELREETGLITTDCSYLFEYTSRSNQHKVFLIKCTGTAEPKNEIKYLAYFDGSNVNISDTTKKIIERYHGIRSTLSLKRCEVCSREDILPFKCNYCGKTFCAGHRLPESHNCASLSQIPTLYPYAPDIKAGLARWPEEDYTTQKRLKNIKKYRYSQKKLIRNITIFLLIVALIGGVYHYRAFVIPILLRFMDRTPPTIRILSPTTEVYDVNTIPIPLIYTIDEPTSWVGFSLNDAEKVTLTDNTILSNLSPGRYDLTVYANDTAGNMGFSEVSFIVTYVFGSLDELISFLRKDDLSDRGWSINYTCVEFAKDFIQRAEMKGYYCFTYYDLWGNELDEYINAVESIKVVKNIPGGTETRWYWVPRIGVGHAVVKTTVGGMDVIVDPQTDVILKINGEEKNVSFTVLYEGEITQE